MRRFFIVGAALSLAISPVVAEDAGTTELDREFSLTRLAQLEQELGNGGQDSSSPIVAGWDKKDGFYLKDADDNFKLRIGGRGQFRYVFVGRDNRGNSGTTTRDSSYFDVERLRFRFRGHVLTDRLTYDFQFDGDTDRGGGVTTLDALAMYEVAEDTLKVGVGQYKAHFLRQEKTSSSKLQMIDRSIANEFFNIDRVLGVVAQGELADGFIFYAAGVNNGFRSLNRGAGAVDQIPAFVGKLDFNLLGDYGYGESDIKRSEDPNLVFGVSFASDQNNGTSGFSPQYKVYQAGVDTGFKLGGFSLQGEYMGRWLDYETTAGAGDPDVAGGRSIFSHGWYVQGGFMVTDSVEIAGRASVVYGNEGANDGTATEFGPGINWFFNGHKVKLSTDVIFFDIPSDMPRPSTNLERSSPLASPSSGFSSVGLREGEQGIMVRTQLQVSF